MASDNYIDYPEMVRQREDNIQQGSVAKAEDVNAEFNHIVSTFNQLVSMLEGEWGGTGRIYELVDTAVSKANEALSKANGCVLKAGDTMEGQLNQPNVPASDYNLVNKKYVDDKISSDLTAPLGRITTLENNMSELFQSVSNGKTLIAAAITDKGVSTAASATFEQMADNIKSILTFNEGTANLDAYPYNVQKGKTFAARGQVLTGTLNILDTTDATATASDIKLGRSAYVKGEKVWGTHDDEGLVDTTDGTATPNDIRTGKIAYVNGQKITGTLNPETGGTDIGAVEKIYGEVQDKMYLNSYNTSINGITTTIRDSALSTIATYDSGEPAYSLTCIKDNDTNKYKIRIEQIKFADGVVASHTFNLSEFGLPDDTATVTYERTISAIGVSNLSRVNSTLALVISEVKKDTSSGSTVTVNSLYLYCVDIAIGSVANELASGGNFQCIKMREDNITWAIPITDVSSRISFWTINFCPESNTDVLVGIRSATRFNDFYWEYKKYSLSYIKNTDSDSYIGYVDFDNVMTQEIGQTNPFLYINPEIQWVKGGKLISIVWIESATLLALDDTKSLVKARLDTTINSSFKCFRVSNDGQYVIMRPSAGTDLKEYNINIADSSISLVETGSSYTDNDLTTCISMYASSTYAGNFLVIFYGDTGTVESEMGSNTIPYKCKVFAMNYGDTEPLHLLGTYTNLELNGATSTLGRLPLYQYGRSAIMYISQNRLRRFIPIYDYSTVIGLRYEGRTYYDMSALNLTASTSDVTKGKTFIGVTGYREKGTRENSSSGNFTEGTNSGAGSSGGGGR